MSIDMNYEAVFIPFDEHIVLAEGFVVPSAEEVFFAELEEEDNGDVE